jgi:hypothetical protein
MDVIGMKSSNTSLQVTTITVRYASNLSTTSLEKKETLKPQQLKR